MRRKSRRAKPQFVCDFCGHWWQNKRGDGPDCVICGIGSKVRRAPVKLKDLAKEADAARKRVSKYTAEQRSELETPGRLRSLSVKEAEKAGRDAMANIVRAFSVRPGVEVESNDRPSSGPCQHWVYVRGLWVWSGNPRVHLYPGATHCNVNGCGKRLVKPDGELSMSHALESIDLALLALGGPKEELCRCDPSVGQCPCEYCAEYDALRTMRKFVASAVVDTPRRGYVYQMFDNSLAVCVGHNGRREPLFHPVGETSFQDRFYFTDGWIYHVTREVRKADRSESSSARETKRISERGARR